jgi:hypothetical protein
LTGTRCRQTICSDPAELDQLRDDLRFHRYELVAPPLIWIETHE